MHTPELCIREADILLCQRSSGWGENWDRVERQRGTGHAGGGGPKGLFDEESSVASQT